MLCCNASRPLCPSDNIDGAPLINAHENVNPAPAGPVTLNTFALILSQRAADCATMALDLHWRLAPCFQCVAERCQRTNRWKCQRQNTAGWESLSCKQLMTY